MTSAVSPTPRTASPPARHRFLQWLDRLASLSVGIAGVSLLGLVLVQGWQVFARYVMNDSPSWTEPVTLLLLATAMSLGAAAAVHEDRHFRFHLLAQAFPAPVRRGTERLTALVTVAIGAVLAFWGARLLLDGISIRMAGAPLPQSIAFLPLFVGGALMVLFALPRLWSGRVAAPEGQEA